MKKDIFAKNPIRSIFYYLEPRYAETPSIDPEPDTDTVDEVEFEHQDDADDAIEGGIIN